VSLNCFPRGLKKPKKKTEVKVGRREVISHPVGCPGIKEKGDDQKPFGKKQKIKKKIGELKR